MSLDPPDAVRKLSGSTGAEQDLRFLADASAILSSSLDYQRTMRALARLAVPMFGDYCAVDVIRDDGTFEPVEVQPDGGRRMAYEAWLRGLRP